MAELDTFRLHPGDPAPPFSLPGTDGRTYKIADFANDPFLLVVFWCNHCPYVRAWEGRMIDIGRRYAAKGVRTVLINSNDARAYPEDSMSSMVRRAKEQGYPFPYLQDESQDVAHAYGALVTPHPLLFDRSRRLLFQGRIDNDHQHPEKANDPYLVHALEQALGGTPVEPSTLSVLGCTVKWRS
jgi:peroxiredoxin